ncbi:TetR-like C-terminal domain-containing protein [Streptococcus sp. UBA632]|uniref:TetR-like C-terminal domain-containing protein n=1 Tax=Streptococcus TaxID=1301 RepID=UPI003438B84D
MFQIELREQVTDNLEYISGYQLLQELLHYFSINKHFYIQLFKVVNQNDFSSYFQTYCQQLVIKIVKEYHSQPFDSETEYKLFINYHSQAIAGTIKQSLTLSDQDYQKQALLLIQLIKKNIEN